MAYSILDDITNICFAINIGIIFMTAYYNDEHELIDNPKVSISTINELRQ